MSVEQDARYALTETGLATIWVRVEHVLDMTGQIPQRKELC